MIELLRLAEIGHGASHYYSMLMNHTGYPSNTALKIVWERDLNITVEENN